MKGPLTGLRAWVVQRLSAVYLLGYLLYLAGALAWAPPPDHAAWVAWMQAPAMAVATVMAVLALLLHAWVGVRDVILDYVGGLPLRAALLSLVALVLVAEGLWAVRLLLAGGGAA